MKAGDVVRLKSGGLPMTVLEVGTKLIGCLWMKPDGALGLANIEETGLVLVSDPAPAKKVTPRRCACGHSLGGHDAQGVCLKRGANRAPCSGKCRIIEAGEE